MSMCVKVLMVGLSLMNFPSVGLAQQSEAQVRLENMETKIEKKFPEIAEITPAQLNQQLSEEPPRDIFLIDVRAPEEFEVSHIQGAVNLPLKKIKQMERALFPKDKEIVLYCSVGYRSAQAARFLKKQGVEKVFNLRGSVFAWAHQGYPVYRNGEQVFEVHPYDRKWGRLLEKRYHPLSARSEKGS